jgi:CheY-like chemotaxis protein
MNVTDIPKHGALLPQIRTLYPHTDLKPFLPGEIAQLLAGVAQIDLITNLDELRGALESRDYSVVLCDHEADCTIGAFLRHLTESHFRLLVVLITSLGQESDALRWMQRGVTDYVFSDRLNRLPAIVARASAEYREPEPSPPRNRNTSSDTSTHLRQLLENLNGVSWLSDVGSSAISYRRRRYPVNALVASRILTKVGYGVHVVSDGRAAIEAFEHSEWDAILMDVHRPVVDGLEATRAIRNTQRGKQVPIIALTASAMAGDREICLAAGMNDYLTKPFVVSEALEKLRAVIAKPESVGT